MASIRTKAQERSEQIMKESIDLMVGKLSPPELPKSLLQQAHEVIHGDRENTYGDPGKNLRNIAAYWSVHLSGSCGEKITLTEQDVCVMMILMKQARLINTPAHKDSLLDTAGYAALADIVGVAPSSTQ